MKTRSTELQYPKGHPRRAKSRAPIIQRNQYNCHIEETLYAEFQETDGEAGAKSKIMMWFQVDIATEMHVHVNHQDTADQCTTAL